MHHVSTLYLLGMNHTRTYECTLISNACHSLLRVARGSNIFIQIMVTFLSYISNACHSLSGVAERLQHTSAQYTHEHMHVTPTYAPAE